MSLVTKLRDIAIGTSIAALLAAPAYSYFVPDTVRAKIIDTQVKRYRGSDKYLVFTDSGVFENTDAWYRLKFDSSDLQAQLIELKGKTADLTKSGWRFGPFSWYENILEVKEVKP